MPLTVWKPAPTTPLISIAISKLVAEVLAKNGHAPQLCSLVCAGADVG